MNPRDGRSVGELLLEADHTARGILMDVDAMDAAVMLRSWGEVVQSADELWHALPALTPVRAVLDSALLADEVAMPRLRAMSDALHSVTRGRGRYPTWPGEGPGDQRLLQIAACMTRATDLLTTHDATRSVGEAERRDGLAVRARIMHTLYLGSHGVGVAVGRYVHDLQRLTARGRSVPRGESLQAARAALARIDAFEQHAGAAVAGTYPHVVHGEHRAQPSPTRLARALARWDVQAHRALSGDVNTADLMHLARTQAFIVTALDVLLRAAAEAGHIDQAQHQSRLAPALQTSQDRWAALAVIWAGLTPPARRRGDHELQAAALETRAAMHELLSDGAAPTNPATIAARTDLSTVSSLTTQVLATNVELAHVTQEAVSSPHLTGPARAVNTMAIAAHAQGDPRTVDASPPAAWIAPRDLLANNQIPLPDLVRDQVAAAGAALTTVSRAALSAAAFLASRQSSAEHASDRRHSPGRDAQERGSTLAEPVRPGARCER